VPRIRSQREAADYAVDGGCALFAVRQQRDLTTGCGPGYIAKLDRVGRVVLAHTLNSGGTALGFQDNRQLLQERSGRCSPPIASGAGQALAFNQDGTPNSVANPARLGTVVTLFANGLGTTAPPSVEGQFAGAQPASPTAPVQVRIGDPFFGQTLFAATAQGMLTSVTKIEYRLPPRIAGAGAPATLTVSLDTNQFGYRVGRLVTIAVTSIPPGVN
jgi:hypothetical protein